MDPQQKVSLDPKLKEVYDSVMGNNAPSGFKPPPPSPQEPAIVPTVLSASGPQIVSQPLTFSPQPSFQSYQPMHLATHVPTIVAYHSSVQNKQTQEKKWRLRWILVAFLIVAFLLGYAIFWIKVFGIKLPLLSSFF